RDAPECNLCPKLHFERPSIVSTANTDSGSHVGTSAREDSPRSLAWDSLVRSCRGGRDVNIVAVNDGDASMASVWNSLPNLGFFQSPELGDLYTASTRHKVLRVVTMDGESPTGYAQVIVFREGPTLLGSVGAHGTIRHGPVIRPGAGEWEVAALLRETAKASHGAEAYALLLETHKRARFPLEPRGFFEQGFRRFYPRQLQIFIARSGNTPVATSVLAVDGDAAVNWYAGSVTPSRMRQLYPNDALIWEAIRWSRAHGLSTFDMGGGGPPGTK